jgi:type II secretion system protein G
MKLSHIISRILKLHGRAETKTVARRESGFTLLELLVVIVILGLLIGLVAPAVLRQLGNAKVSIARQSVARIGSVLDLYKLDAGSYPSTQDGLQALITKPDDVDNWAGPYLKGHLPHDAWGRRAGLRSLVLGAQGHAGHTRRCRTHLQPIMLNSKRYGNASRRAVPIP